VGWRKRFFSIFLSVREVDYNLTVVIIASCGWRPGGSGI
jgi:hypothetical protein